MVLFSLGWAMKGSAVTGGDPAVPQPIGATGESEHLTMNNTTEASSAEVPSAAPEDAAEPELLRTFGFEWDPQTDKVRRDPPGARMLGLGPEGCTDTGLSYFRRIHPEDRDAFISLIKGLTPARPTYRTRYRVRDEGGTMRVLEEHGRAEFDASGMMLRMIGIGADVTSRLEAQRALEAAERASERDRALLAGILDRIPVMITVYDPAIEHMEVNREFERVLGWSNEELCDLDVMETCYPDPAYRAEVRAFMDSLEPGWRDFRIRTRDGAEIETTWANVRLSDERHVGIGIDIRERKRVEAALRESEARFRAMAETIPGILFTADGEGRCTYLNPRFSELTGMAQAAALGSGWVEALHPEDRPRILQAWRHAVGAGGSVSFRYRLRTGDGSYRWFETRARRIAGGEERISKWFGVCSDIDDMVATQKSLEEADRRKNDFLAVLGHELRNPMAPIRSALDAIALLGPADEAMRSAVDIIDRQSRHMERLVDDLLDVSRIIRGKLALQRRPVGLAELIDEALDAAQPLIEERRHRVVVRLPTEEVSVEGDPVRLVQVLVNLLSNAAKYTAEGGEIRVDGESLPDQVVVRVADNGAGIGRGLMESLFDAFAQGERRLDRAPGGLGLGLSIARGLTELHGGRIEARSEGEGKGSEFSVYLPRAQGSREANRPRDERHMSSGSMRILVVDDNADVAQGMGMLLGMLGYEVELAYSGAEAIDKCGSFAPRVVLLDIGMEGMDGLETARRLRARYPAESMTLAAVSGYGDETFQSATREAGFDHHLIKPVNRDALLALLNSIC